MVDKPASGETIETAWGVSVANAINRVGVGMIRAWSVDTIVQPGSTFILPWHGVEHNARLFMDMEEATVRVTEGRRGVYVVTAYLMFTGLHDGSWARGYLYRNGTSFAGNGISGAGGTGIPMTLAGIDQFEELDGLTVRVSVAEECTVDAISVSMLRIAENS